MQIFQLCYNDIFVVQREFFFIYNIIKYHIKAFSNGQQVRKNFQVFDQNEGYMGYPLRTMQIFRLSHSNNFIVQKDYFFIQNTINHNIKAFLEQKQIRKNFQVFWPKSWVNPLEKCKFFNYLRVTFL